MESKDVGVMVKLRAVLMGVIFAAIAVGFAAAMPSAMRVADVGQAGSKPTAKPVKTKSAEEPAAVETESETAKAGDDDDSGDPGEAKPTDNHGAAVSAIAKCDVKGRWHGEAVRSIAQNKDATLADVQAACAAAQAAAAAAQPKGKAQAKAHGKPDSLGQPAPKVKAPDSPKPAKAPETQVESDEEAADPAAPSGDRGPPPGKGNSKKP